VALFRAGNDEAFRVIHDRYRQRLLAYTRQMLPGSRQDAEDALQDVFVRAYSSLRSNDRELALRAWLYRVAHNRCIDELRRPAPAPEMLEFVRAPSHDPIAEAEQRESLRRLIEDVRRLPDQQRSALLMRELSGMSYFELAGALGATVPAVKSLLVRARVSLAAAQEARDTACSDIREELIIAHDRRVRPNATARRHMRDCAGCREFRVEMRSFSRQLAALVPTLGPAAVIAKALGIGGGAGGGAAAGGSAAAGGGAAVGGSATLAGTGAIAASGALATGASHVATLLAAAVITAGGAVAIQSPSHQSRHRARHHAKPAAKVHRMSAPDAALAADPAPTTTSSVVKAPPTPAAPAEVSAPPPASAPPTGQPRTATPPHIPASADSVTLQSSGESSPADGAQTGGATRGASATGSVTGGTTAEGTSTTATTPAGGTTTSTTPGATSALSSTGQPAGSATQTPPQDSLPQMSPSTSTSTGAATPADTSSSSASGSSTEASGTSGTPGGSSH